jgi:hypothetical protein
VENGDIHIGILIEIGIYSSEFQKKLPPIDSVGMMD